jgi:hypothetical protein
VTDTSNAELSLTEPTPAPQPAPAPSLDPDPAHEKAVKRCCAAWRRSYNAYMEKSRGSATDKSWAAHQAGPAYCDAMPLLAGYENIRDFIACLAHGILIGAIPASKSGQLLYAAQVALSTVHREPRPPKPRPAKCPPLPPLTPGGYPFIPNFPVNIYK